MKITKIAIAAMLLIISGCQSTPSKRDVVEIVSEASRVAIVYQNSKPIDILTQADLTQEEEDILIEALVKIEEAKISLKSLLKEPEKIVTKREVIYDKYQVIRYSYIQVKTVVALNFDEYPYAEREAMTSFDELVQKLDASILEFYEKFEEDEAINTILMLADTGIRIAAMM